MERFLVLLYMGVIGLDLSEPGPDGMPRIMVGLVKIHYKLNANEKPLMFSDAQLAFATSNAPMGGAVLPAFALIK